MKGAKVLIFIVFGLCILALGGSYYLHKIFFDRIQYYAQEQDRSAEKIDSFSVKLTDFRNNLDDFNTRFRQYSDTLERLEETVSATQQPDATARIDALKSDIEGLRSSYLSAIALLQDKMSALEIKVGPIKDAVNNQKVELGELSIEKKK
ncbi:MAG: hypothetical protein ABH865_03945 [Candidatus Omnitrophota bacterium]|nr:hypothetical protein [Candidatus Omnitrophota bacterium]